MKRDVETASFEGPSAGLGLCSCRDDGQYSIPLRCDRGRVGTLVVVFACRGFLFSIGGVSACWVLVTAIPLRLGLGDSYLAASGSWKQLHGCVVASGRLREAFQLVLVCVSFEFVVEAVVSVAIASRW
jgi:hypothetical protein